MNKTIKPILSFCIPTYNRIDKLEKLVKNILDSPLENIEVVVLDNCSTDDTMDRIGRINDRRLIAYRNEKNTGGIVNGFKALSYANGIYAMLCLDKDWVEIKNVGRIIDILDEHNEVDIGYCTLNLKQEKKPEFFKAGKDAVPNMAYLSKHPTGNIYKTEIYKRQKLLETIYRSKDTFGFYSELLNAEIACFGNGIIINLPFVFIACEEDLKNDKTVTYTRENMYFLPRMRINEYLIYMRHLCGLGMPLKHKKTIIKEIFLRGLLLCTVFYRYVMSSDYLTAHYSIKVKNITLIDLMYYDYLFASKFLLISLPFSFVFRFLVCIQAHIRIVIRVILKTTR
jgi:glycosyltransferase involved in cell wall biosynthesis